ncbi:expressed unknown protein [Seminavis robusta]|uniref:Uncharacterized protein n=1 Tax=Seminavis robusta TaxID=568900 RepID=A0A9N8F1P7_9STRA|nr:expressed unknown protein [Seminavis robusta]|eukprot:Sro2370_g325210.1 n/a (273) ;mRNA; f:11127-11945
MNTHAPEIVISVASPSSPQHKQEEDDRARWEMETSPCFPRPLCVALPPKRPARQATAGAKSDGSSSSQPLAKPPQRESSDGVLSPPKYPFRRVTRFGKLTVSHPPQRPTRQDSEALLRSSHTSFSSESTLPPLPGMDSYHRLSSLASTITDNTTSTSCTEQEEYPDESCSILSLRLQDTRLDGSSSRFQESSSSRFHESSSAELTMECCPSRPVRQKSAFPDVDAVVVSSSGSENSSAATGTPVEKPDWVKLWESQGGGDFATATLSSPRSL